MRWRFRPQDPLTTLSAKRARVWAKTDGRCWYGGERLEPEFFHIDHVVPRASGGTNDMVNLVPTCPVCNRRKAALTLDAFRAAEERRLGREPGRIGRLFGWRHRFWFEQRGLRS